MGCHLWANKPKRETCSAQSVLVDEHDQSIWLNLQLRLPGHYFWSDAKQLHCLGYPAQRRWITAASSPSALVVVSTSLFNHLPRTNARSLPWMEILKVVQRRRTRHFSKLSLPFTLFSLFISSEFIPLFSEQYKCSEFFVQKRRNDKSSKVSCTNID